MSNQKEIWNDINGYEELYQVSSCGRVRSLNRYIIYKDGRKYFYKGIILKPVKNKQGYNTVVLKNIRYRASRLVGLAFVPNPENKLQINHKNGIRDDDKVSNIEWMTNSENNLHAFRVLKRKPSALGKFGKENPSSKPVIQSTLTGKFIKKHYSMQEAERETGVSNSNIVAVCRNRRRKAGGYLWSYC